MIKCPDCKQPMIHRKELQWKTDYLLFKTNKHDFYKCEQCRLMYCSIHNDYNYEYNLTKLHKAPKGWNSNT